MFYFLYLDQNSTLGWFWKRFWGYGRPSTSVWFMNIKDKEIKPFVNQTIDSPWRSTSLSKLHNKLTLARSWASSMSLICSRLLTSSNFALRRLFSFVSTFDFWSSGSFISRPMVSAASRRTERQDSSKQGSVFPQRWVTKLGIKLGFPEAKLQYYHTFLFSKRKWFYPYTWVVIFRDNSSSSDCAISKSPKATS